MQKKSKKVTFGHTGKRDEMELEEEEEELPLEPNIAKNIDRLFEFAQNRFRTVDHA